MNNNKNETSRVSPDGNGYIDEVAMSVAPTPADFSKVLVVDEYDDYVSHPVLYKVTDWVVTDTGTTVDSLDLIQDLMNESILSGRFLAKKLTNFMYVKGHLRVTVVVQGSSVAMGKMAIGFEPNPCWADDGTATADIPLPGLGRIMQIPHLEIDPAETKTYQIDLPPVNRFGVYSLAFSGTRRNLGSWKMVTCVMAALGSGTAIVPSVGISVYLSLVSPKVSSATSGPQFTWTSGLVKEHTVDGKVSTFFDQGAQMAKSISGYVPPQIKQPLTVFSKVSESTAAILRWLGYSKPVAQTTYSTIGANHNLTYVDDDTQTYKLTTRANQSVGIDDSYIPGFNAEDMVITALAERPAIVARNSITLAMSTGALVREIKISPMVASGGPSTFELTPAGFVTLPHYNWRADAVIDIEFVASIFHRATVVVLYEPDADAVMTTPYQQYVGALQHWTFHIAGHSKHRIEIPWKQIEAFKWNNGPMVAANGGYDACNGKIVMFVQNPVTTNGSTDPVLVLFHTSFKNLRLGHLNNTYQPVFPVLTSANVPDTEFYHEFFGEEAPHTTKEMAARSCVVLRNVSTVDGPMVMSMPTAAVVRLELDANSERRVPLVDYLGYGYVGMRGSVNYSVLMNGMEDAGDSGYGKAGASIWFENAMVSKVVPIGLQKNWLSSKFDGVNAFPGMNSCGPIAVAYEKIEMFLKAVFPHYYEGLFVPSLCRGTFPVAQLTAFRKKSGTDPALAEVYKSAGEDFSYVFFRGLPACNFVQYTPFT